MSEPANLQLVKDIYAAFGRGDLEFLLARLAPDVTWSFAGGAGIPWGGERRGPDQVRDFFVTLASHVHVDDFATDEYMTCGDRVIVLGHEGARVHANGRTYRVSWVQVWTIRGGKAASFTEYTDTAAIAAALAGR